eukprot:1303922-Prymnesium_polylepis.1
MPCRAGADSIAPLRCLSLFLPQHSAAWGVSNFAFIFVIFGHSRLTPIGFFGSMVLQGEERAQPNTSTGIRGRQPVVTYQSKHKHEPSDKCTHDCSKSHVTTGDPGGLTARGTTSPSPVRTPPDPTTH